jgi:hypothetical protein
MARYGREYRQGSHMGRRYDVGYGAGGYPRGRERSGRGRYERDYAGVAYRRVWVPENPAPLLPENLAPGITFVD